MNVMDYCYRNAAAVIQWVGLAVLAVPVFLSLWRRPEPAVIKVWELQVDSLGLPESRYCFSAYRRRRKIRVRVDACPAFTASGIAGVVSYGSALELTEAFQTLDVAQKASRIWAKQHQHRLAEGV